MKVDMKLEKSGFVVNFGKMVFPSNKLENVTIREYAPALSFETDGWQHIIGKMRTI